MPLTDAMIADGWLPHDGGPCPVALDSEPGILWGDGHVTEACHVSASEWAEGRDSWQHKGPTRMHIIAYRPVQP